MRSGPPEPHCPRCPRAAVADFPVSDVVIPSTARHDAFPDRHDLREPVELVRVAIDLVRLVENPAAQSTPVTPRVEDGQLSPQASSTTSTWSTSIRRRIHRTADGKARKLESSTSMGFE